ncbi:MAG: hypothetical protein DWQ49_12535 [Bacteroidetes bacterium]|nr:MAG: hypothetical protein DWQ49_12535 [Bacteroidota bacterium]
MCAQLRKIMNTTTYRKRVPSSIQSARRDALNVQSSKHPAREEIKRCLGTHTLTAVVEEDMQTLASMPQVNGLIAFLCTLTKDGRVIAQGRGSAVLSPTNRFVSRAIACAFNSALSDSVIRATKVLDTFRSKDEREAVEEAYKDYASEPATEKQRDYLTQLVHINCEEEERERWLSQINAGELTKDEASRAIAQFAN